jgi:hypothetical protein
MDLLEAALPELSSPSEHEYAGSKELGQQPISPLPAQVGWMNAGKPLPKKLLPVPENKKLQALFSGESKEQDKGNIPIPTSAKAGPLGSYWVARLDQLDQHNYHPPVKGDKHGMLGHLGKYVGDKAGQVIDIALRRWDTFKWRALNDAGIKSYPPDKPQIWFLVKHHASAVNMLHEEWRSAAAKQGLIASKQASKPRPAPCSATALTSGTDQKEGQPTAEVAQKIIDELPPRVLFTAEQLAFYANLDCIASEKWEAFVEEVNKKYGCTEFVPG